MKTGILSVLLLALLLAGGAMFNDRTQTVLAREPVEQFLQCSGPEIPVGKVREQTDLFSQEIVRLMFELAQDAKAERSSAKKLMATSDACTINRCVSSCVIQSRTITIRTCNDPPVCENIEEEQEYCSTEPSRGCGGEACPRQEINDRLKDVEQTYVQLQATQQAFSSLLHEPRVSPFLTTDQKRTWRDHILFNLERVRNGLQACVTPANFYDTAESDQEVDVLISCQEARLNGVLSEKQAQCFNNNFFCCTIKPTQ